MSDKKFHIECENPCPIDERTIWEKILDGQIEKAVTWHKENYDKL